MNTRWIFNDSEFNRLYELTRGVELRTAERVFIKSFHSLQKLTGEELEFPSLSSVDSMLEWVKQWKENLYQTCLQTDKTKDIYMFARVILYTDEHIEENLKSEEAAAQIGMSRSYFSTRFKEMTGDTFHNYVISRKMYAAAQKMAKGTENITQIASNLGYDNFYYFTKVFSKEYGCMPTEYVGRIKKCSI
ncbi:MAG: helix-turn-helix domain-containing protein [Anaerostipes sp.]